MPQVVADPTNHDLVGVEPHPDAKPHAVPQPNGFGENAHGVADVQGGEAGSLRVIFVGDGSPEQSHGAVAGELMHRALEAVYAFGDDLKEVLDDVEPLFRIEPRRKSHRALDVGEQHSDVLALAFQLAPGLANLVREMRGRRRVAPRQACGRARRSPSSRQQRYAAIAAEVFVGFVRQRRTRDTQSAGDSHKPRNIFALRDSRGRKRRNASNFPRPRG